MEIREGSEFLQDLNKDSQNADSPGVSLGRQQEDIAKQILELASSYVVANNQFLASALGQLKMVSCPLKSADTYATTMGEVLYDPYKVVQRFLEDEQGDYRGLVHILMHYILLHPYTSKSIDKTYWNLACDICAEQLTEEILGDEHISAQDDVQQTKNQIIQGLIRDFKGSLTQEKLYRKLCEGNYNDKIDLWQDLFYVDSHEFWYPKSQSNEPGDGGGDSSSDEGDQSKEQSNTEQSHLSSQDIQQAKEKWKQAAKTIQVDLETRSRKRGSRMKGLINEVSATNRKPVDYREFLRQFAVRNEDMRLSDEEFDYIFYTYGLSLYEDMPLIEPLEYRIEKQVRDFVIVIDTSSSVTGRIVQQFIDTTFDVLMSQDTFAEKVNIHIIQCDARVRKDTKITSIQELGQFRKNIKLIGFGGTDFRPAFRYINELYHSGEFQDLGGVIYFTDGWGEFPKKKPNYDVAFVYIEDDYTNPDVPPWAMKVVLQSDEI